MATIRYTHGWSLFYQIVFWIASLALWGLIVDTTEPILDSIQPTLDSIQEVGISIGIPRGVFSAIGYILLFLGFIGSLGLSIILLLKTLLQPELPTYLYVRLSLLTPISWKEAEDVSFIFDGDISGRWYPLLELRQIPRECRHEFLMEFAEQRRWIGYYSSHNPPAAPHSTHYSPSPQIEDPSAASRRRAYDILGVTRNAGQNEIKAAYRRHIKKYHPDIYANSQPELKAFAEEKAKELNSAFELLENVDA